MQLNIIKIFFLKKKKSRLSGFHGYWLSHATLVMTALIWEMVLDTSLSENYQCILFSNVNYLHSSKAIIDIMP